VPSSAQTTSAIPSYWPTSLTSEGPNRFIIVESDFASGTGGFVYQDDTFQVSLWIYNCLVCIPLQLHPCSQMLPIAVSCFFCVPQNTNQPHYASGTLGGGCLNVELGGVNGNDIDG
jgi:hypothetical protein